MKKAILMRTIFGGLLLLPTSIAGADEKSTLQQLLQENQNLAGQLEKANKAKGDIAKAELAIEGADIVLKHAEDELRRKGAGLVEQWHQNENAGRATGCPWGTMAEKAYADACNTELARLEAIFDDLEKQGAPLKVYGQELAKERTKITQGTMEMFARKKTNNADLEELEAARTEWNHRYKAFLFRSQTYERLKVMAPSAQICEQITDLAAAKHCLDQIWASAP